jgi:hypothetical protein
MVVLLALLTPHALAAPASGVVVCHRAGSAVNAILVNGNAVAAHQAHGDALPGTWYRDVDGDGHAAGAPVQACVAPPGALAVADDCDDADATVHPGAAETCDGRDEDCDHAVDEGAPGQTWYGDTDGDGFGDDDDAVEACEAPPGAVAIGGDCDDAHAEINPQASETCSGVDDDCDGLTDEADASGAGTWYADADADHRGDAHAVVVACDVPAGYVGDATDCDDGNAAINLDAPEVCDGQDDDCDGSVDEDAIDARAWHPDADADHAGDRDVTVLACAPPVGTTADGADCDDTSAAIGPAAAERCDGVDDDCDALVDEPDAIDAPTWFADTDHDGYGDPANTARACVRPGGFTDDRADCDDLRSAVHPGAPDAPGDGIDEDCDGRDATPPQTCGSAVWTVPGDFGTIQAAITAACDGDRIEVGPGDWTGNLDLGAKAITLSGAGIGVTVVRPAASGSTIVVRDGSFAVLRGLTVRGGSEVQGGGIALLGPSGVVVQDVRVEGASAKNGAGMFVGGGVARLERVELVGNHATGSGGGLYTSGGADVTIVGSTIADDVADESGGGMLLGGTTHLVGTVVRDDDAYQGGGIEVALGTLDVVGGEVAGNYARNGGGVEMWQAAGRFDHVTFDGNTAWRSSGGAIAGSYSAVVIVGGSFVDNQANEYAGGITADRIDISGGADFRSNQAGYGGALSSQHITVHNAVFAGNQAWNRGGAIDAWNAVVAVDHATFVGNRSPGGASIGDGYSDITVTNSIFAHETGAFPLYGSVPTLGYSDAWQNEYPVSNNFGISGTNRAVDPGFVGWWSALDPASWDLHLAPGGPLAHSASDGSETGAYGFDDGVCDPVLSTGSASGVDVVVRDGLALVAAYNEGLVVLDADAPDAITQLGRLPSTAFGGAVKSVTAGDGIAWVAVLNQVVAVDVSDPSAPSIAGVYAAGGFTGGTALDGELLYVAAGAAGLEVVDVSDPTAPVRIGGVGHLGTAVDVAVSQGLAVVSAVSEGATVVDVAVPTAPVAVSHLATPDDTWAVALDGRRAFVAIRSAGLMVADLADPAHPVTRTLDVGGYPQAVELAAGRVYLPLGFSGDAGADELVAVVDVSGTAPVLAAPLVVGVAPMGVDVADGVAWIVGDRIAGQGTATFDLDCR